MYDKKGTRKQKGKTQVHAHKKARVLAVTNTDNYRKRCKECCQIYEFTYAPHTVQRKDKTKLVAYRCEVTAENLL